MFFYIIWFVFYFSEIIVLFFLEISFPELFCDWIYLLSIFLYQIFFSILSISSEFSILYFLLILYFLILLSIFFYLYYRNFIILYLFSVNEIYFCFCINQFFFFYYYFSGFLFGKKIIFLFSGRKKFPELIYFLNLIFSNLLICRISLYNLSFHIWNILWIFFLNII